MENKVKHALHKVILLMGVSGSGKTTIGKLLAEKTGYDFFDADDFHPRRNIDKMKAGEPLTDEDRWPWLDNLNDFAGKAVRTNSIILACSALKAVYRQRLTRGIEENCTWIFLNGDYRMILDRMRQRKDHYMPAALLESQFETLEIPGNAIEMDISKTPEEIVAGINQLLQQQ